MTEIYFIISVILIITLFFVRVTVISHALVFIFIALVLNFSNAFLKLAQKRRRNGRDGFQRGSSRFGRRRLILLMLNVAIFMPD